MLLALDFLEGSDDRFLHMLLFFELEHLIERFTCLFKLANLSVSGALAEECLFVLRVLFNRLACILDRMMILLQFIVAMRQVSATVNLDLLNERDSLLLGRDHRIFLHLKKHLHP